MLILGLLGMYFDAVLVFVLTFFQIGPGHTVCGSFFGHTVNIMQDKKRLQKSRELLDL